MSNPLKRYQELDSMRGIAALMVVFFHFTMHREEAKYGFEAGRTGVDLFFIISGFVIFMSLEKTIKSRDFIINRVIRLYPTYWASVTFTFLLLTLYSVLNHQKISFDNIKQYVGNLTMFQYYLKIKNLDGPYWTMIIEMIFYAGMLFLFNFNLLKHLNKIGLSLCLVVVLVILLYGNELSVKSSLEIIPLLQFIPLFFAGTIFYKIYTDQGNRPKNYTFILICFISQLLIHIYSIPSFSNNSQYSFMIFLYFISFILFINNWLKFIVCKLTLFFGKISFALYLVHQCVSTLFIIPFSMNILGLNFWYASIFVALPCVIAIASFITYFIEIPVRIKIKQKIKSL